MLNSLQPEHFAAILVFLNGLFFIYLSIYHKEKPVASVYRILSYGLFFLTGFLIG